MGNHNKNILLVTCSYPDSYAQHVGTFVASWAEQLDGAGMNVIVYKRDHITFGSYFDISRILKYYRSPPVYHYVWRGIRVCRQGIHLRLPLGYSKSAPKVTYRKIKPVIAEIYKEFPFDIIYLATWGDLSLAMSWIAKEMGIPYIASAIGDHTTLYFDKPSSLYYKLEKETYLESELVVCVSEDMNEKVKVMTDGKARTFTFYSGVDTEKFQPVPEIRDTFRRKLGYAETDCVFLFVGRITREKGIYELLEAFASISKEKESLKLMLVGPIFERSRFKKKVLQLGITHQIKTIGGVGHDDIPGYMNAADVFAFPSWMEGLPNVVMEACSCELPVIASRVGGIPEIIEDEVSGFLVSPRCPEELAEKMEYLIDSPEFISVIARKARQKMRREFNYRYNGYILTEELSAIIINSKE